MKDCIYLKWMCLCASFNQFIFWTLKQWIFNEKNHNAQIKTHRLLTVVSWKLKKIHIIKHKYNDTLTLNLERSVWHMKSSTNLLICLMHLICLVYEPKNWTQPIWTQVIVSQRTIYIGDDNESIIYSIVDHWEETCLTD